MSVIYTTAPASSPASFRSPRICLIICLLVLLFLAGCSSRQGGTSVGGTGPGGYPVGAGDYRRDGPHPNPPPNLHLVPDAVPRIEPLASGPNRPYVVGGRRFVPDTTWRDYRARGRASWYGRQFHGRPTSNGDPYDMYAMTAAHPTLPIPSYVRVTNTQNGRSVIVRVNDRGPFVDTRIIDLSYVAALKLGTLASGTGEVLVELITPQQILAGTWQKGTATADASSSTPASVVSTAVAGPSAIATSPRSSAPAPLAATVNFGHHSSTSSASVTSSSLAQESVYLQLGAFGAMDNAQTLARRLAPHQSEGRVVEVRQSPDQLFRVRLGPYVSRQHAMAEVESIYRHTGIMPHVVAP